jgi:hypothetical protein
MIDILFVDDDGVVALFTAHLAGVCKAFVDEQREWSVALHGARKFSWVSLDGG